MAPSGDRPAVNSQRSDDDRISTYTVSEDGGSPSDTSERRRLIRAKKFVRAVSLIAATLITLCAGSNAVFSLYAPKFQSRLRYTQFQVNGVAIGSSIALYLPISVMGYICDRAGPAPLSLAAAFLFATGYGTAATIYRKLDIEYNSLGKSPARGSEWSYPLMIFSFVCIGAATCGIYISAVSTCAKNFGKGKYRGLALAMPITGFGLSGMWISQFASQFLYTLRPDGSKGDVDVFLFFVFLAVLLFAAGVLGFFTLKVVDEQDLIEEAIEELEQSGLLDDRSLLRRTETYGTNATGSRTPASIESAPLLAGSFTGDDDARWKKNWVLNAETRRFLADHTMWPFALSFLLMVGPGEAFINNLGTVIGTLSPPSTEGFESDTSAATHVSIFGVTSTLARLLIGTITDLVAPAPETQHVQLPIRRASRLQRFTISRVAFMLFFAMAMSFGMAFLASGAAQNHADRFWVASGLIGAGYGAIFSLAPLIVTIIWGVENFATNFGIVTTLPALGSTFWGLVYAAGYQAGAHKPTGSPQPNANDDDALFCYGKHCYSATFWGEAITVWIACALLLWAWLGPSGWKNRGILI